MFAEFLTFVSLLLDQSTKLPYRSAKATLVLIRIVYYAVKIIGMLFRPVVYLLNGLAAIGCLGLKLINRMTGL